MDGDRHAHDRRLVAEAAAHETPTSMAAAGVLVGLMSIINGIAFGLTATANGLHAVAVAALLGGAAVVRSGRLPAAASPWVAAAASAVLVGCLQVELHLDPSAIGMGYVILVLTAFGPFVLDLRAFLVAAGVMLVGQVLLVPSLGEDGWSWLVMAVAALAAGGVLLRIRWLSIVRLGRASELASRLSRNDQLTGVLNRRGLDEAMPALLTATTRRQEQVMALFLDVDGLKTANDRSGHIYGDSVLVAVVTGVLAATRTEDLVCRWGGDELLVIGSGAAPDPDAFARRVMEHPAVLATTSATWPGRVSVGVAALPAAQASLDDLVRLADADMYRRRRAAADGSAAEA